VSAGTGDATWSRRKFLHLSSGAVLGTALAGTGAASALLAACGSSSKTSTPSATTAASSATTAASSATTTKANYGAVTFQLSWIKNDEFSGEFIADSKGYYLDEGFTSVNLLSGGPNVSSEPVVVSGKALMGLSSPDVTASAILKGADLIIIGAQYQKNPFAIMSLAKTPINNPQEMIGKKIGVQSGNQAIWTAFLKANNIPASKVDTVPVQFDPSPLAVGTVDGWFSYFTNEPNLLRAKGVDVVTFLLNDYHYPECNETYLVTKANLTSQRDKIKAFMRAEIRGWQGSIADPAAGPILAVDDYGKTLGLAVGEQTLESASQNELLLTADTMANGLFTITPELQAETINSLSLGGIDITAEKLFDPSLLTELYSETPALKTSPNMGTVPPSATSTTS
jgi:ABC-type nitrate/sulfonate/bicarbonate transport system substrate-binding protein